MEIDEIFSSSASDVGAEVRSNVKADVTEMNDDVTEMNDDVTEMNDDGSEKSWYENAIFQRYWNHYRDIRAWFQRHEDFVLAQRSGYEDWCQRARPVLGHVTSHDGRSHYSEHQNRRKRSSKRRKRRKRSCQASPRSSQSQSSTRAPRAHIGAEHHGAEVGPADGSLEFEMEITDEMLDFFSQSEKHRRERDSKKASDVKMEEKFDDHYVDLGEVSSGRGNATVLPPSERPGSRRIAEMRDLYGDGAPMIHGMETAMQLSYDRHCDRKKSKLWPTLPLNMKFS